MISQERLYASTVRKSGTALNAEVRLVVLTESADRVAKYAAALVLLLQHCPSKASRVQLSPQVEQTTCSVIFRLLPSPQLVFASYVCEFDKND